MGGFMLYYGDEPRATLTPEELKRFVDEGSVEAPIIVKYDAGVGSTPLVVDLKNSVEGTSLSDWVE
jgi:hypothetical protein